MLKIYLAGIFILFIAILLNGASRYLGIMSWYEFLNRLQQEGSGLFSSMRAKDYTWLFLIYPFLLGLSAYAGFKLTGILIK